MTFLVGILWALVMPSRLGVMANIWETILPGFTWLTPGSMTLGLIELFRYGIYIALVLVPLFNYFEYFEAPGDASGDRLMKTKSKGRLGWNRWAYLLVVTTVGHRRWLASPPSSPGGEPASRPSGATGWSWGWAFRWFRG